MRESLYEENVRGLPGNLGKLGQLLFNCLCRCVWVCL